MNPTLDILHMIAYSAILLIAIAIIIAWITFPFMVVRRLNAIIALLKRRDNQPAEKCSWMES